MIAGACGGRDEGDANERNTSQSRAGIVPAPWPIWGSCILAGITVTILAVAGFLSLGPGLSGFYLLLAALVALYGTGLGLATLFRIAFVADGVALILVFAAFIVR